MAKLSNILLSVALMCLLYSMHQAQSTRRLTVLSFLETSRRRSPLTYMLFIFNRSKSGLRLHHRGRRDAVAAVAQHDGDGAAGGAPQRHNAQVLRQVHLLQPGDLPDLQLLLGECLCA
jgi:hypothetical protein